MVNVTPCSFELFGLDLKYAHVLADQSSRLWTGRFALLPLLDESRFQYRGRRVYIVLGGLSITYVCALLYLKFQFFTLSTASTSEICRSSSDINIAKRKVGQEVCRWPERFWFFCNLLLLLLSSFLCGGVVGKKSFQDALYHLVNDSSMNDFTLCSVSGGLK